MYHCREYRKLNFQDRFIRNKVSEQLYAYYLVTIDLRKPGFHKIYLFNSRRH